MERLSRKFRFVCDCGEEVVCKPSDVFREDGVKSCGRQDCEHHRQWLLSGHRDRAAGVAFEFECADKMAAQGFEIEMTPTSGDYGVDFFAVVNGERVAFQCKKQKKESSVGAVQEVYAGGRYYDCCKFVVVCPSGFSYPAELMASKLGVQLEQNLQNFRLKSLTENKIETQKITTFSGRSLVWEIDGVSKTAEEWCREYGVTRQTVVYRVKRKGMDLKTALTAPHYDRGTTIEIDGVVKTKKEWCAEYGISPQLYDYRIKYSGMSPIEALTKEKAR